MNLKNFLNRYSSLLVVIGGLILWQLVCTVFQIPDYIFPSPLKICESLIEFHQPIFEHALQTLYTTIIGFAIAVIFGMWLGVVIGTSPLIYRALYPILVGFNSVPKVALVPILIIWFGSGTLPAVITAFIISFFPIVVNVATGLATIEPELKDVLRSLGATERDVLIKVGIPRSLPYFFASLKIAVTLAFVGSVISETVASNKGVGYLMISASSNFDTPLVFAGLVVIAVMGIGMYEIFARLEGKMTHWAQRDQVSAR